MTERSGTATGAYAGADDDLALVERAVAGDNRAFDTLFANHYPRILSFALRLTGTLDAAEEVAQATFVRAHGSLSRLRDGRAFLKLLYRIAVNLVRDQARRAARKPWVSFADLLRRRAAHKDGAEGEFDAAADPALDPALIVTRQSFSEALAAAVAGLPAPFREVVALHHMEGMDLREIAAVLAVPEGTVKSRLGRARRRLHTALAPWMGMEDKQ